MLRSAKDLSGFSIAATDGEIGQVEEFFVDEQWVVRCIVVNIGCWFKPRKIMMPPSSVYRIDWSAYAVETPLTREEVKRHPKIVTLFSDEATGTMNPAPADVSQGEGLATGTRGTRTLNGFAIATRDRDVGHVDDFIINDERWTIDYVVIDTRNWWPGKKVIIPPSRIKDIDWRTSKIQAELSRKDIKNNPEYDDTITAIEREYEERIQRHYDEHCDTCRPYAGSQHDQRREPGTLPGE